MYFGTDIWESDCRMSTREKILFMFLGWFVGLTLKYVIVGLRCWDIKLHPERLQGDLTGPYQRFANGILGNWLCGSQ